MKTLEEKAKEYDEMVWKRNVYNRKRNAKRNLLIQKAIAQSIEVSDKEIDEYLQNN